VKGSGRFRRSIAGGRSLCGRLRFWYERCSNDPPATRGRAGCATRRGGAQGGRGVVHRRSLASVPEVAAGVAWCVQRRRAPDGAARKPRAPGLENAGRGDALNRVEGGLHGVACTARTPRERRQPAQAVSAMDTGELGDLGPDGLSRAGSGPGRRFGMQGCGLRT
jgi:hypothetical protein